MKNAPDQRERDLMSRYREAKKPKTLLGAG
jgi:hypothetical protein